MAGLKQVPDSLTNQVPEGTGESALVQQLYKHIVELDTQVEALKKQNAILSEQRSKFRAEVIRIEKLNQNIIEEKVALEAKVRSLKSELKTAKDTNSNTKGTEEI